MKQNWIPVTEKMPEEHDSMFARFKGTDDGDPCFFEKISRDVFVTLRDKKGNTAVAQAHTTDGKWRGNMLVDKDMAEVIAWMPAPEPYKNEKKTNFDACCESVENMAAIMDIVKIGWSKRKIMDWLKQPITED